MASEPKTKSAQPALAVGGATAVGTLIIQGLVIFNFATFTDEQKLYLLGLIGFLAPFVQAFATRARVFSGRTVAELLQGITKERDQALVEATAAREAAEAVYKALPPLVAQMSTAPAPVPQEPAQPPQRAPETSLPTRRRNGVDPALDPRTDELEARAARFMDRGREMTGDELFAEPGEGSYQRTEDGRVQYSAGRRHRRLDDAPRPRREG